MISLYRDRKKGLPPIATLVGMKNSAPGRILLSTRVTEQNLLFFERNARAEFSCLFLFLCLFLLLVGFRGGFLHFLLFFVCHDEVPPDFTDLIHGSWLTRVHILIVLYQILA